MSRCKILKRCECGCKKTQDKGLAQALPKPEIKQEIEPRVLMRHYDECLCRNKGDDYENRD